MKIQLLCDMLLDQNRSIGEDKVGHKCSRPAVVELLHDYPKFGGALVCRECLRMLIDSPSRLSLPALYGRAYQLAVIRAVMAEHGIGIV